MAHHKLVAVRFIDVEQINERVEETGQQAAAWTKYTEGFLPDGAYLRRETVRYRMEHDIETFAGQRGQIGHITFDQSQAQLIALGDKAVLRQLSWRNPVMATLDA